MWKYFNSVCCGLEMFILLNRNAVSPKDSSPMCSILCSIHMDVLTRRKVSRETKVTSHSTRWHVVQDEWPWQSVSDIAKKSSSQACPKFRFGHEWTAWQIDFFTCTNVNRVAEDLQTNKTVFMMSNSAALLTSSLVNVPIEINGNVLHLLTYIMCKFKKKEGTSWLWLSQAPRV